MLTSHLGALGCGVYKCPPCLVAEEMKSILLEPEFKGWFKKVVFALGKRGRSVPLFQEVFDGVKI